MSESRYVYTELLIFGVTALLASTWFALIWIKVAWHLQEISFYSDSSLHFELSSPLCVFFISNVNSECSECNCRQQAGSALALAAPGAETFLLLSAELLWFKHQSDRKERKHDIHGLYFRFKRLADAVIQSELIELMFLSAGFMSAHRVVPFISLSVYKLMAKASRNLEMLCNISNIPSGFYLNIFEWLMELMHLKITTVSKVSFTNSFIS